jgi:hypothetical protein
MVLHVGIAVNGCVRVSVTTAVVGLTATETMTAAVIVIIAGELCTTTPFSVALTKSPTVPMVLPAVNVIDEPLPVSVPFAPFERVHE